MTGKSRSFQNYKRHTLVLSFETIVYREHHRAAGVTVVGNGVHSTQLGLNITPYYALAHGPCCALVTTTCCCVVMRACYQICILLTAGTDHRRPPTGSEE